MDPISVLVLTSGEDAVLMSPATTARFSPSTPGDYAPNAPVSLPVKGVPETKIEHVVGAVGGFTMQATQKPAGLKAEGSKLAWRGETWTVLKYRQRTWRGVINGYTLYLGI